MRRILTAGALALVCTMLSGCFTSRSDCRLADVNFRDGFVVACRAP